MADNKQKPVRKKNYDIIFFHIDCKGCGPNLSLQEFLPDPKKERYSSEELLGNLFNSAFDRSPVFLSSKPEAMLGKIQTTNQYAFLYAQKVKDSRTDPLTVFTKIGTREPVDVLAETFTYIYIDYSNSCLAAIRKKGFANLGNMFSSFLSRYFAPNYKNEQPSVVMRTTDNWQDVLRRSPSLKSVEIELLDTARSTEIIQAVDEMNPFADTLESVRFVIGMTPKIHPDRGIIQQIERALKRGKYNHFSVETIDERIIDILSDQIQVRYSVSLADNELSLDARTLDPLRIKFRNAIQQTLNHSDENF